MDEENQNDFQRLQALITLLRHPTTDGVLLTPLIVDNTPDETSLRIFKSKCHMFALIDGNKMHLEYRVQKKSMPLILEEKRHVLLHAMKTGRTLVLRLGATTVDLINVFNDEAAKDGLPPHFVPLELVCSKPPYREQAYFPKDLIYRGGADMLMPEWREKLFRREDRDDPLHSETSCLQSFNVILTTTCKYDDLDKFLFNGKYGLPPRHNFSVGLFN